MLAANAVSFGQVSCNPRDARRVLQRVGTLGVYRVREQAGDGQCFGGVEFDGLAVAQVFLDLVLDVRRVHRQPERFALGGAAESVDEEGGEQGAAEAGNAFDDLRVFPQDLVFQGGADKIGRQQHVGAVDQEQQVGFKARVFGHDFMLQIFPARVMPANDARKVRQWRAVGQILGAPQAMLLGAIPLKGFAEFAMFLGTRYAAVMQHAGIKHSFITRLRPLHFASDGHGHQGDALAVVRLIGADKVESVGQRSNRSLQIDFHGAPIAEVLFAGRMKKHREPSSI